MLNVILLGPSLKSKGGITSVLRNYLDSDTRNNIKFDFLPVNRDTNKINKIIFSFSCLIKFTFKLITGKYDIIHAHPSENFGFFRYLPYFIIGKLFGKKIIFHIHGGRFDIFFSNLTRFTRKIIISILNSCDAVICLSESWKIYFNKIGVMNTHVVNNTVHILQNNPYSESSRIITFIGFIEEKKGIFDLVNAFGQLGTNSNCFLEICGTGQDKLLTELISDLKLVDSIQINGWVDADKKDDILKRTGIFVLPSYFEGLPMVLLEAMAHGIPIISTPVGGIPELVENNINGHLISPGNIEQIAESINLLINNRIIRKKMSINNFNKIKNYFSMENTMQKLEALYSKI